ncbi:tetratricopeptide repeat protein [Hwanghaeella grinnelliae]|uniref:Tetratricopeptide repeat protein n=1 Tax=Hwanghaeella grinnelliae TaxID=2500179 RepID=A0A437QP19_9PROT|nr:transglutaminase-like domain-containing protein [Hwanghaeella grinnelliae]RVU36288.1 tetratricopeptide repeat protein [Hwanghaeella grinnelliae]
MPGDAPSNRKPSDPKAVLRHLRPDADGRLPIAQAALAAALLDPVTVKAADHPDEALSHLDALAADAAALLEEDEDDVEAVAAALNHAILDKSGYAGDSESYEDIQNANLFRVIERRRGLPVTLGIIYMHVGRALGYRVDGLAFPGHFLIRLDTPGGRAILDPFFGGIQRDAAALRDLLKTVRGQDAELDPADYEPVPDMDVLNRVQNNIKLRLVQADKKQEAATVCETMLMYNPRDAVLWREAGLLHADASNMRAALAALTNYVDIVPESSERRQIVALMRELRLKLN